LLLEHAEISKRWTSHDSAGATAVPIATTKINDAIAGGARNPNKFVGFEETDAPLEFQDSHVT
jgi:hypothetical protein